MRFRIAAAIACMTTLGCVETTKPAPHPGETFYEKTAAGWVISCWQKFQTGTGTIAGHNECSLLKKDGIGAISLSASASGRKLSSPSSASSDICGTSPRAHGVDGRSLLGQSFRQQLAALSTGTTYFREFMSPWPNCGISARQVALTGFVDAYSIFDREAKVRGW